MKIYTKQGDSGMTSLIGGERVFKTDLRVEAYGTVDELSAYTALLCDLLRKEAATEPWCKELQQILSQMMTVEAVLAVGEGGDAKIAPFDPKYVAWLEERIDAMQAAVKPLTKFTIPGGHLAVSTCHICRTVCRRAERVALRADQEWGIDPTAKAWLNRLSDYFYLLGRSVTERLEIEEQEWIP